MESIKTDRRVARLDDYRRRMGTAPQARARAYDPFLDHRRLVEDLLILTDCLTVVTEILSRLTSHS